MPAVAGVATVAVRVVAAMRAAVSAVMPPAPTRLQGTLRLATQCSALRKGVAAMVVVVVMAATTSRNVPLKASLIRCAPVWT